MKKLITLSILFALTSSVFISCKSSSSVMKRRYNKGYYVHHAAKHSEPKTTERTANNVSLKSPVIAEAITVVPATKEITPATTPNITANAAVSVKKSNTVKASKHSVKTIPAEFSVATPFKTLKNISTKVSSGDTTGDALSLLWIVIVVILILYLLSFLFDGFGLGGFVHILAVIALILLILWLLRIL